MRRPALRARGSRLAVGLAVVGLMLAGCVNLPSGGVLQNVNSLPNSAGSQVVITPRAPGPQWDAVQIVGGFLVASGANDLSIARDYLYKKFARAWHPTKATPTVIDTGSKVAQSPQPRGGETGGQTSAQVTVTSDHLEKLVPAGANEAGRLQVSRGPAPYVFTFELIQFGGEWRIDSIIEPNGKTSDSILLLTDSDFERDFLSRNLYYLASGAAQTLVPYPVYIPAKTGQLGGVKQLVKALRTLPPTPSNWLYHVIATAFPPGTRLTAVGVQGSRAVVELGGAAARAGPATLNQIEAQLVWTLTYPPDSPTGISSVELQVGHRSMPTLQRAQFASWIPQGPPGPLYFQRLDQAGGPRLEAFTPANDFGSPNTGRSGAAASRALGIRSAEPLPAGLGRGPFTTVAVSPGPPGLSYFAGCRGKKVYVAPVVGKAASQSADLFGNCTSLSWDNQGDLWAVAGNDIYVLNLPLRRHPVIPVSIPAQQIAPSDSFVSVKVAPDGLRVAMIVQGKNGASVYISAITKKKQIVYLAQGGLLLTAGPDLVKPMALTWWDSDHLLVLERQHGVPQLYDVPLNGRESTKVPTPSNAVSVTADGSFIAVGTGSARHGRQDVLVSRGLDGPWLSADPGSTPTY